MALFANPKATSEARPDSSKAGVQRWQERDRNIAEHVVEHPSTCEQVGRLFFPGRTPEMQRKKASRRLSRLAKRGVIRALGLVLLKGNGRPQIVYGGSLVRSGMLEHEVLITEVRLHFNRYPFERSVHVGNTTADALFIKEEIRFYIEVDTHRMDARQMRVKWQRYGDCRDYILVICQSEKRLKKLKQTAEKVKRIALFSTLERLKSGQGEPWEDCDGQTTNV